MTKILLSIVFILSTSLADAQSIDETSVVEDQDRDVVTMEDRDGGDRFLHQKS